MAANLTQRMKLFGEIARHGDCSGGALRVAFALLYRFYNGDTGRCDPGQTRLAQETGLSMRHVKRAIDELEAGRWFDVQRGAGTPTRYGQTTVYAPKFGDRDEIQGVTGLSPVADLARDDESVTPQSSQGVTSLTGVRDVTGDMDGRQGVTDLSPRTSKRTSNRLSAVFKDTAGLFESFWQIYPRRDGGNPKKPAREKFAAAVRRGADASAIVRGAENYAAEIRRNGTAARYVAQAVTWLNQERWEGYQTVPDPQEDRPRVGMC
jgi:hypothetical protein